MANTRVLKRGILLRLFLSSCIFGLVGFAWNAWRVRLLRKSQSAGIPMAWKLAMWDLKDCTDEEECRTTARALPNSGSMESYRKVGWTKEVQSIAGNDWFRLERHSVQHPGGSAPQSDWMWTEVPDMLNVLVQNENKEYIVFRQHKYGLNGETMATLGGYVKAGELPRDAAVREIREELGRECQELRYLGKFRTDANRGFGSLHAFAGEQCAPHAKTAADAAEADKEQQQQLVWSEVQLRRALLEGKFREVMRHPAGAGAR